VERLLKDLNSRNEFVRRAALREARALPPETLAALLAREVARKQRLRRKYTFLSRMAWRLGYASLCIPLWLFHYELSALQFALIFLTGALLPPLLSTYIDVFLDVPSWGLQGLFQVAGETADPRFLASGLLLYGEVHHSHIRKDISSVLKTLLPQMRVSEDTPWTKEQRAALLLPLKYPLTDVALTVCVLKALEQIGEESAVPVVQKLANLDVYALGAGRIRQAAEECLPYLTVRVEQARHAATLLRPAAGISPPDTLLRPAGARVAPMPSEQLLRPNYWREGCADGPLD
jgi:hypothetical protein